MPGWCKTLLFPGGKLAALLSALGSAGLFLTFKTRLGKTPFAYFAYVLSAYAPTIAAAWVITKPVPSARRAGALQPPALCGTRDRELEFRHYRDTGFFLLVLDGALGVIAVEIVQHGHSCSYPGTLIYVAALHAFYSLSLSIANAVKYKRFNSPVLSAAKAVNLTTALVSIFTLEIAMLSAFGEGYPYQALMTAATAGSVWVLVFCIAARMVLRAGKHLRRNRT